MLLSQALFYSQILVQEHLLSENNLVFNVIAKKIWLRNYHNYKTVNCILLSLWVFYWVIHTLFFCYFETDIYTNVQ